MVEDVSVVLFVDLLAGEPHLVLGLEGKHGFGKLVPQVFHRLAVGFDLQLHPGHVLVDLLELGLQGGDAVTEVHVLGPDDSFLPLEQPKGKDLLSAHQLGVLRRDLPHMIVQLSHLLVDSPHALPHPVPVDCARRRRRVVRVRRPLHPRRQARRPGQRTGRRNLGARVLQQLGLAQSLVRLSRPCIRRFVHSFNPILAVRLSLPLLFLLSLLLVRRRPPCILSLLSLLHLSSSSSSSSS